MSTIVLDLPDEVQRYLAALGGGTSGCRPGRVDDVLLHLATCAADGVSRPGSAERRWLHQVFGGDFEDNLMRDPSDRLRDVPRPKRCAVRQGS